MSIINDAIKKAKTESKIEYTQLVKDVGDTSEKDGSEKKWVFIAIFSLVLIFSLLGSIVIYKNMSRVGVDYGSSEVGEDSSRSLAIKKEIQRVSQVTQVGLKESIELNGIVYGPDARWAIINNKIVREGDSLLDGKVTLITEELVRIERPEGKEIVLNLRR